MKQLDAKGEAIHGDRTIDQAQANIIRRIFADYAAGRSAKRIATELNREKVRAPSGGDWGLSTIIGNTKRGTGILNNELYIGKLVWNRQHFVKDPATGKRQARLNPPEEWVTQNVPEMRVVDDDVWAAVKARQARLELDPSTTGTSKGKQLIDRRRPRYVLSGLT